MTGSIFCAVKCSEAICAFTLKVKFNDQGTKCVLLSCPHEINDSLVRELESLILCCHTINQNEVVTVQYLVPGQLH